MRISDWSSDVCSSDLLQPLSRAIPMHPFPVDQAHSAPVRAQARNCQRRQPTNRRKRPCVATVISSRRYPPAATKRLSTMQRRYVPACIYREELGKLITQGGENRQILRSKFGYLNS